MSSSLKNIQISFGNELSVVCFVCVQKAWHKIVYNNTVLYIPIEIYKYCIYSRIGTRVCTTVAAIIGELGLETLAIKKNN